MSDSLQDYSGLEEATTHFLVNSYNELHKALIDARAALLFESLIDEIELPGGWVMPELPRERLDLITEEQEVLPPETLEALADAWNLSMREATSRGPRLSKNEVLNSVAVAGHFINLFVALEAASNKSLLVHKESRSISADTYKSLDNAGVVHKLLYLLKDQFSDNKLNLGHLSTLASMRNKAAHYRRKSRSELNVKVKTIIDISKEAGKVLGALGEHQAELDLYSLMSAALQAHLE